MSALTAADHARILELAEAGMTCNAIARELGKHAATVQWFLYREGLRAPTQIEQPKSYSRGGRTIHRFTSLEDAFIEALRIQDYTTKQIAEFATKRFGTNRSPHTIRCRLIMLAARETAA